MLTPDHDLQAGDLDDDRSLFRAAVHDVIAWPGADQPRPSPTRRLAGGLKPRRSQQDEPAPELPPLSDTLAALHPLGHEEEVRFRRSGVSLRQLRQLAQGREQALPRLDLHGLRLDAARSAIVDWIDQLQRTGCSHALLIHGKGRPELPATLKTHATRWLMQHPSVLALCSAQARDGGRGALYVLLRRRAR